MSDQPTGLPTVIEYETMSGVIVRVTPLSAFTVQAVGARSEREFPYPDPEPYRTVLENAADPSIKLPASDNPEYKALCALIDDERIQWRAETCLDLACAYPAFPSREHMLAHFRPQLERLKAVADLPDEDEFHVMLKHCVFTGKRDRQTVLDLAVQSDITPLTMPEVVDTMRVFRLAI